MDAVTTYIDKDGKEKKYHYGDRYTDDTRTDRRKKRDKDQEELISPR